MKSLGITNFFLGLGITLFVLCLLCTESISENRFIAEKVSEMNLKNMIRNLHNFRNRRIQVEMFSVSANLVEKICANSMENVYVNVTISGRRNYRSVL